MPDIKCDPQNCPTGTQLQQTTDALRETVRELRFVRDTMIENTTKLESYAEVQRAYHLQNEHEHEEIFKGMNQMGIAIAKKLDLASVGTAVAIVCGIAGAIYGLLRFVVIP